MTARYEQYLAEAAERQREALFDYLRIPSISTLPEHAPDIADAAEWVRGHLERIGLREVRLLETGGNPIVYGEWLDAGPDAPTLLLYGHYDVQPAEPLELWETPPFEPTLRDGRIYARGATDNKGPLFTYLAALETVLAVDGTLPCNVKLIVEGEEELRADHLDAFLAANGELLAADACVISDSALYARDVPSIALSLRGMAALQFRLETAATDLHSGMYGGVAPNALHAMARLLATLHDEDGRVAVPGFYDAVRPLPSEEIAEWVSLPFDEEELRVEIGARRLIGGGEHAALERMWARPTLDLHGVWGGFQGEGIKTVIPREAHAKLSCRLVADMEPEPVLALLEEHLRRHCPPEAELTIEWTLPGASPMTMPRDAPLVATARAALEQGYGREALFFRSGWSVPVAALVKARLGIDSLLLGFGLPTDGAHAPNEHFDVANLERGTRTMVAFFSSATRR
ncbi:MAG: dipeptidase [Mycolicibacterium hassiacum]|uniref:dipeptidase n=1 Tax=Mycolicibacterium hassiacum TaxID=46351 RepID=UPI0023F6B690|nr:dipeptidase [Mycolicibacterium hassiacum]MBX5485432.1 dipeptidase [Mycolicibacterium hassiacum]